MSAVNKHKDRVAYALVKSGHFVVSRDGVVRNRHGKPMGTVNNRGYVMVHFKYREKIYLVQAHRLVWMAFKGSIPDGLMPNHKNGNKQDNRLTNLELLTNAHNIQHAFKTGLIDVQKITGSNNSQSKLTERDVNAARALSLAGVSYRKLAVRYGVSHKTIKSAIERKTWKHVV